MRFHNPRPQLTVPALARLAEETQTVANAANPKTHCDYRWKLVRQATWFKNGVVAQLKLMSGTGEPCMWCDCNTSTDVEHYRPKAVYPEFGFIWENYVWSCGECNGFKGNRFPPETENGEMILNPLDDQVWDHYYIDQFGNLNPKWNIHLNQLDQRAVWTIKVVKLDRETLQERRQIRLAEVRQTVLDSLHRVENGTCTIDQLRDRMRALVQGPFQPDVADYFLNGPGRIEDPFSRIVEILGADL
jgi:uncharacterized protein (TIGR02646 family)